MAFKFKERIKGMKKLDNLVLFCKFESDKKMLTNSFFKFGKHWYIAHSVEQVSNEIWNVTGLFLY